MESENLIAGHNKQEITVIKSQVASKASLRGAGINCFLAYDPRNTIRSTGGPWF